MPRGGRAIAPACLEQLARCDAILHAGDFVAAEVLGELESLGPPVLAVHGNVDEPVLRHRLPERRVVTVGDARIGMVHDTGPAAGRLERMRLAFPDAHAVVFGHSHLPFQQEADGFRIFNPGSPTERRRAPSRSFGTAHVSDGRVSFRLHRLS